MLCDLWYASKGTFFTIRQHLVCYSLSPPPTEATGTAWLQSDSTQLSILNLKEISAMLYECTLGVTWIMSSHNTQYIYHIVVPLHLSIWKESWFDLAFPNPWPRDHLQLQSQLCQVGLLRLMKNWQARMMALDGIKFIWRTSNADFICLTCFCFDVTIACCTIQGVLHLCCMRVLNTLHASLGNINCISLPSRLGKALWYCHEQNAIINYIMFTHAKMPWSSASNIGTLDVKCIYLQTTNKYLQKTNNKVNHAFTIDSCKVISNIKK